MGRLAALLAFLLGAWLIADLVKMRGAPGCRRAVASTASKPFAPK